MFLERSGARVINSDSLNPPRPDCTICSTEVARVLVNPGTTTLNDIVEMLRSEIGYGEELAILKDSAIIYDPDEDTHLEKTLTELGIANHSSITVVDEDDEDQDPRVNLDLYVFERYDLTSNFQPQLANMDIALQIRASRRRNKSSNSQGTSGDHSKTQADSSSRHGRTTRHKWRFQSCKA